MSLFINKHYKCKQTLQRIQTHIISIVTSFNLIYNINNKTLFQTNYQNNKTNSFKSILKTNKPSTKLLSTHFIKHYYYKRNK